MSYCTVMCVLCVLHIEVLCVKTVLLYAAMCHHHGLPRVHVPHISTAKHACTPSECGAYLIATRDGMFVPRYHSLYICVMCTYVYPHLYVYSSKYLLLYTVIQLIRLSDLLVRDSV